MTSSESTRFPTWLGALQGVALYALYTTHHDAMWPIEWGWLFNGALLGTLLLPFVIYWGQDVLDRAARRRLLGAMAVIVFGLGAYQGAMIYPQIEATRIQLAPAATFFALVLLVFMCVPLTSGYARGAHDAIWGCWQYSRLFEHAWRNAVVTIQAAVLTGLLWAVLALGAQMFHLIGVDWPQDTIRKAWFAIPVTTLSLVLGLRGGLRRAAFTVTLRNHWLTLTVWLLPLASFIGAAFVLTSLAGVGTLFERGLSAFFLLWFAAFWIKFFNSAYQDGQAEPALHPLLRRALPYTAPALLAVVGLAAWALLVRILQYGLTPDRIWGVLVVGVALTYGVGYTLSLRGRGARWMSGIAPANIAAALVMCAGIVLLLSPALDPNRLATANQMSRLESGRVEADDFDVRALTHQGRAGHDALVALRGQRDAMGKPGKLAVRAQDAIRHADYSDLVRESDDHGRLVANPTVRIDSYPAGKPLPAGFVEFLKRDIAGWESWERTRSCLAAHESQQKCVLLQVDLDRDGRDELVLWDSRYSAQNRVYASDGTAWRRAGHLMPERGQPDSVRAELATGDYAARSQHWDALRVGKFRFQVFEKAE